MINQLKHKFGAVPTFADGIRFSSRKEAKYYGYLKKNEDVLFFLRQVPLHLPGGTVYRADFLEFHKDGTVHFVDVKGMKTDSYKIKKREIEAIYPITIEEV